MSPERIREQDAERRAKEAAEAQRINALLPPIAQRAIGTLVLRLPANANATIDTGHDVRAVTFRLRRDHPCADVARIASPLLALTKADDLPTWTISLPLGEGVAEAMLRALEDLDSRAPSILSASADVETPPVSQPKSAKRSRGRAA